MFLCVASFEKQITYKCVEPDHTSWSVLWNLLSAQRENLGFFFFYRSGPIKKIHLSPLHLIAQLPLTLPQAIN